MTGSPEIGRALLAKALAERAAARRAAEGGGVFGALNRVGNALGEAITSDDPDRGLWGFLKTLPGAAKDIYDTVTFQGDTPTGRLFDKGSERVFWGGQRPTRGDLEQQPAGAPGGVSLPAQQPSGAGLAEQPAGAGYGPHLSEAVANRQALARAEDEQSLRTLTETGTGGPFTEGLPTLVHQALNRALLGAYDDKQARIDRLENWAASARENGQYSEAEIARTRYEQRAKIDDAYDDATERIDLQRAQWLMQMFPMFNEYTQTRVSAFEAGDEPAQQQPPDWAALLKSGEARQGFAALGDQQFWSGPAGQQIVAAAHTEGAQAASAAVAAAATPEALGALSGSLGALTLQLDYAMGSGPDALLAKGDELVAGVFSDPQAFGVGTDPATGEADIAQVNEVVRLFQVYVRELAVWMRAQAGQGLLP